MKYLKNLYFCSDSFTRSWYGLCNHVARTASVLLMLLTIGVGQMWGATATTVYYAVPAATVGTYTVKLNVNFKGDGDDWHSFNMTKTDYTYLGDPIYTCTFTDAYDGLGKLQFQLYDGDTWKSEIQPISSWTAVGDYNGKLWTHAGDSWQTYGRDITIYAIPEDTHYALSSFTPGTHTLKANVKVGSTGSGEWLDIKPVFEKTDYKYNGNWLYKAQIFAKYNVIVQIQFQQYNGESFVKEYDCNPGSEYSADDIDGKIFGGNVGGHTWYAYGTDITLDQQSGSGGTSSVTATVGSSMPAITLPTRAGYSFGGYFTGTNGAGTKYYNTDGSSAANWIKDAAPTTLYAHWVALPADGPTAPTYQECQVLPIYCQYYTHTLTPNLAWGVGIKTDRTIGGVNMWEVAVSTEGYFGFDWGWLPFGVDDYTGLHMDVYTPTVQTLQVVALNRPADNYGGNEEKQVSVNTSAEAWTAINIPISDYTDQGLDMKRLYTLKIMGNAGDPMLITNVFFYKSASCPAAPTPVAHSKGIGTAQAQNVPMFQNNNGNLAGTITNDTIDFYVATLNDEIIYKVATTHDHTMWSDANTELYVLNSSNERVTHFTGTRNVTNTISTYEGTIPAEVDKDEFDWNMLVPYVGAGSHTWNGRTLTEKMTYKRGFVNIPNSDVTVPTMTSAAIKSESVVDGDTTVVITGAADNSGEFFYYFEDEMMGIHHISLSNEYTIPATTDGRIYNIDCYVVDFNGNMSAKQTVTIAMPYNVNTNLALNRPITIGVGSYATRANDGDTGTRMEGAKSDYINQWMYVDLMGYYTLSEIKIYFENACSDNFVLQAAHTLPSPANEDTYWRTIYTNTTTPKTGNTGDKVNTYDVSGSTARYVRFKSYNNSHAEGAYGFSMWEFEVYGSAVVSKDATAPTVSTASVSAIAETNKLQLTLVASDGSKVFRIVDSEDNVYVKTADVSNHVVMDNIAYTYCTTYTFSAQAMDDAANLSEGVECSGSVSPAADFDLTEIPEGGVVVSVSGQAGDPWQAAYAIDNVDNTYWAGRNSSGESNGEQWIDINIGRVFTIGSVKVAWNDNHVSNLYIEGSRDGSDYYLLKHVTTAPTNYASANNAIAYETYTIDYSHIRVSHVRLRATGLTGEMAIRDVQILGSCTDEYANPIMIEGALDHVLVSSSDAVANLYVNAFDEATASGSITYKAVFTTPTGITDITGLKATDGEISLTGLSTNTDYTVQIYAADGSSNVSENYKEVSFSTKINLYYLTGDGTGAYGVWGGALGTAEKAAKRRFEATAEHGIYRFAITAANDEVQYRPYCDIEGDYTHHDDASHWSGAGNQVIHGHAGETITVYAKDKDHFVSNFDEVYVYGDAVYVAEGAAWQMNYADNTFTWEGRVKDGTNTFRVVVKDNGSSITSHSRARLMETASFENSSHWTYAKLTYDITTFTWAWSSTTSKEFCHNIGYNGVIYTMDTYMTGTNWVVDVLFDSEVSNVQLQKFTAATGTGSNLLTMNSLGGNLYQAVLSASDISALYKSDGITRYNIRYIASATNYETDIHYYDFSSTGTCASDYFDIYHHDDDANPDGARTSYAGGTIMQPIRYFRHFGSTHWTTIALPFNVTKVVVEESGYEYPLYPRYHNSDSEHEGDVEGYYWLKTVEGEKTPSAFQSSWKQLTVDTDDKWTDEDLAGLVKPAKDSAYIISFPYPEYYGVNWVIFYGAAGQTIPEEFTGGSSIEVSDGNMISKVKFVGNNTMHSSGELTNIYRLFEEDDYFSRVDSWEVPAFEAYAKGTAQAVASNAALRFMGGSVATGGNGLPMTASLAGGRIYTVTGVLLTTFDTDEELMQRVHSLSTGLYIIQTPTCTQKLVKE